MKKFKEKRMASYALRSNELIQEGKTKEAAEPERMAVYITWRKDGGFVCTANVRNVEGN